MKTKKTKHSPRVFGFWGYDKFPYVLGAPGHIILHGEYRRGCFEAEGYGGAAFSGAITMPVAEGEKLWRDLLLTQESYERTLKFADETYIATAEAMAKMAGAPGVAALIKR